MRGFILGLILGLIALPLAGWLWLNYGHPPVAVADHPLPFEKAITHIPLHRRIHAESPKQPAMDPSPANLLLGANVYREQCAMCHGGYGHPSEIAAYEYPHPPQLWAPHGHGVVGVSDDPAGETYWKVKYGIRLSGMPAYAHILNEAQMWQVSVLLANADKPLPGDVLAVLKRPLIEEVRAADTPAPNGPTVIPVQPLPNQ